MVTPFTQRKQKIWLQGNLTGCILGWRQTAHSGITSVSSISMLRFVSNCSYGDVISGFVVKISFLTFT